MIGLMKLYDKRASPDVQAARSARERHFVEKDDATVGPGDSRLAAARGNDYIGPSPGPASPPAGRPSFGVLFRVGTFPNR